MKKLFILIFVLIGIGINVSAQKKSREELKGDKYTFSYSFDKAILSYKHAKHLSLQGQRRLADGYHKMDQNSMAEEIYAEIINTHEGILPEDYYNYAMILKTNGKYDESGSWMVKFNELKPNDLRTKDYIAHNQELTSLLKDAGKFKIGHLKINSDALDFGTAYYKNKIVFASSRATTGSGIRKYTWTRQPFWEMYVSAIEGNQLQSPEPFGNGLNGKLNVGPASFSNDGTFMAFTKNFYRDRSKDGVVELQIYFSSQKDGKWSKPVPFNFNNKSYSVGQPCLTSDGNTMYFTSDVAGGYGEADIYRVTRDKTGEWGKPENLGDKINTEGYEMFPFYEEKTNTLFFSSNGRFGLGGLDIFSCTLNGSEVGRVYNAGFPLNTQYNDYAVIVNNDLSTGYFSSDRNGGSGGDDIYFLEMVDPDVLFSVKAPGIIPVQRRVKETFPLRNYLFFDIGSTEIPDRYILLRKDQVKDFKEDQLEGLTPKELTGRSKRQMTVYYNLLSILGDRMGKNPTTIIRLTGASMNGSKVGIKMAESVKNYLVNIFGIDASRITVEGRIKPRIPSEQPGGTKELALLREGDNRVSIWSESPELTMEFLSGPDAPLKPVEITSSESVPFDSNVIFNVRGANEAFSSWSLEVADEKGQKKYFGPYMQETESIPGESILGARAEGDYKAFMIGHTKFGKVVKKEAVSHIVLGTSPKTEDILRFSVIFEFNDSRSIMIYKKFLTDIVTPKIPKGGTVVIHGHTDIIGEEIHNLELSLARANEVKGIIEKALSSTGRSDVRFEVAGLGEDKNLAPFDNKYPEERFYNRTVVIDIIPAN